MAIGARPSDERPRVMFTCGSLWGTGRLAASTSQSERWLAKKETQGTPIRLPFGSFFALDLQRPLNRENMGSEAASRRTLEP
jgi:hypothetical protein